ncbi:TPA: bifunctional tRNA (5-methylaminomethyl-2-thiouridine)(34)-methyltransferase MnmD/FAD-dependent 5-carboxymethylaminomethyl-2-thiouridine(34) oxidoreductase MnmC [Legionella feeleii]
MSNPFIPIETADLMWCDGLPFSTRFNDIYFSNENGLLEAEHVFITANNLIERWQRLATEGSGSFAIAETGFGSGLNFLLTWSLWLKYAPQQARLHFISCEKFPLRREELARCLALWPQLKNLALVLQADYPILTPGFHHLQFENGRVNLTLMLGDASQCFHQLLVCGDVKLEAELRANHIDAWFLDGFAPAKNQQMWSEDLFQIIGQLSKPGTTLATFSAAGVVRKNLQAVGFEVKKIKGFGQKREMVVATFKKAEFASSPRARVTPWQSDIPRIVNEKKAIVLGAGLAGCYLAQALAKRGWQVTLIDAQSEVGNGASGNTQAVLYPKLSAYRSPLTLFMLNAFLFAHRIYSQLLRKHDIGKLSGILQLAFNDREQASQLSLEKWLAAYPELGVLVDQECATEVAGIHLNTGGLFIPHSGWLDSRALCKIFSQEEGINWIPDTAIRELVFRNEQWYVAGHQAEVLIIANGNQANQFSQTSFLPLKSIRGQMTMIRSNLHSEKLKIPLCGDGHVLPANKGMHAIGATYHLDATKQTCYEDDNKSNLARLERIPAEVVWSGAVSDNWAGVRAATTDYLPLVGPVPDEQLFRARFADLATNAKRWLPTPGVFHPGLFLCAGFGSRGLTTVPLSAEWLASLINNEPWFLPRTLVQSLSPARFLRKELTKNLHQD